MTVYMLCVLGIFTSSFAVLMPHYFSLRITNVAPDTGSYSCKRYSSIKNTLSELGAINSPFEHSVAYYYFLPLALLNIAFLLLVAFRVGDSLIDYVPFILMSLVSVGYLCAVFFPCDQGSPIRGSVRNQIHNLGGLFEYLGSGLGLVILGLTFSHLSWGVGWSAYFMVSGGVILIMLMLLMLPVLHSIRGLIQRVAEYSYFGWVFAFSVSLLF